MRSGRLFIFALFLLWPVYADAQVNGPSFRPAGMTTVYDCPMSGTMCPTQMNLENAYNTQAFVNHGGTMRSPTSAFESYLCAGCGNGSGQWIWHFTNPTTVYGRLTWATNAEFEGYQNNNNKTFFITGDDNSFFVWQGPPNSSSKHFKYYFQSQVDNCHIPSHNRYPGPTGCWGDPNPATRDGTGWFTPNINSSVAQIARGSGYHDIQFLIKASTCNTCRNGWIVIWIDGVLSTDLRNVNSVSPVLKRFQINHAWDAINCAVMGRDCSKRWSHFVDHLEFAVSGGGVVLPPPTPPPPPPPDACQNGLDDDGDGKIDFPTDPGCTSAADSDETDVVVPVGTPGTITNLSAVALTTTSVRLTWAQQNDGTGVPAKYAPRFSVSPISWGSANGVTLGSCGTPVVVAGAIGSQVSCDVEGLTPGQPYQFMNVAFRGIPNQGATYGGLSNVADATPPIPPPPVVTSFSPSSGLEGVSVVITGTAFGSTIGANTVKLNGQTATVTAASATSLTVTVPAGATTGRWSVQTANGTGLSEQNFTVTSPDPPPGDGCGCS